MSSSLHVGDEAMLLLLVVVVVFVPMHYHETSGLPTNPGYEHELKGADDMNDCCKPQTC